MNQYKKQIQVLFYAAFGVAALLQANQTPLLEDEAYYFLYSLEPALGYFDHPPVIAWLIHPGTLLFQNETGVRILTVLMGLLTLLITEKMTKPRNIILFYLLVLSVPMVHITGFVATPDAPLLFFTALFLLTWQYYLRDRKAGVALLAGMLAAGMMLSKYQGVLVIAFTVLANLREMRSKNFWIMAATAALCMVPHLLWQIENHFPTFAYHLFERAPESYDPVNTLIYLPGQLLVFGVLTAPLILFGALKRSTTSPFERVLRFNVAGFLLFFLLMSLKGQVEPHWTLPALIPALILSYRYAEERPQVSRWLTATALVMLLLIIPGRIIIAAGHTHILPYKPLLKNPFADARRWTEPLQRIAGERPVAFMNSYQRAALYTFYTGKPAMSLNNVMGRKNQFDIWRYEERFRGQEVVVVPNYHDPSFGVIETEALTLHYRVEPNLQAFSRIRIIATDMPKLVSSGETFLLHIKLEDKYGIAPNLEANTSAPVQITYQIFQGQTLIHEHQTGIIATNAIMNSTIQIFAQAPVLPGEYSLHLSLSAGWLPPTFNSNRMPLVVSEPRKER